MRERERGRLEALLTVVSGDWVTECLPGCKLSKGGLNEDCIDQKLAVRCAPCEAEQAWKKFLGTLEAL